MKNILILSLFIACFSIPYQSKAQKALFPYNAYKCFTGTIGAQPAHVYLRSDGGRVNGWYSLDSRHNDPAFVRYDNQKSSGSSLILTEGTVASDGSIPLFEWQVVYRDGMLTGQRKSADQGKTEQVKLREDYPAGTYPFTIRIFNHTYDAFPQRDSTPQWETTYVYPVTTLKNANATWIDNQIKILLKGYIAQSFDSIIHQKVRAELQQYRKDMQGMLTTDYTPSMNYESSFRIDIDYNKENYLVLPTTIYEFAGGAHGNYATLYACYDVLNKKRLQVGDIFKADSATLQQLIESQYRIDNHLKPNDDLTDIYDNTLPLTDNFYFNDIGVCFAYNPYEVAPYARGIIEVLIPYEKLGKYLKPDFKKRMSLQ